MRQVLETGGGTRPAAAPLADRRRPRCRGLDARLVRRRLGAGGAGVDAATPRREGDARMQARGGELFATAQVKRSILERV